MKLKKAIILNVLITIFASIGIVLMLLGIQPMGPEDGISASKLEMFKYYTVDSNALMGIVSAIFAVYEYKILKNEAQSIPLKLYTVKLIATVGVALTFITVVFYLAPIATYGYFSMFRNANLFFHFLVPVLSIFSFCFLEKTKELEFKHTFIGMTTMVLYAGFYTINVLIHVENGTVATKYDWYWFVQNGVWSIVIVVPIMLLLTYAISFGLWKLNKSLQ